MPQEEGKITLVDLTTEEQLKIRKISQSVLGEMTSKEISELFRIGTGLLATSNVIPYYFDNEKLNIEQESEAINEIAELLEVDAIEHDIKELLHEELVTLLITKYTYELRLSGTPFRIDNVQMLKKGTYQVRIAATKGKTIKLPITIEWLGIDDDKSLS